MQRASSMTVPRSIQHCTPSHLVSWVVGVLSACCVAYLAQPRLRTQDLCESPRCAGCALLHQDGALLRASGSASEVSPGMTAAIPPRAERRASCSLTHAACQRGDRPANTTVMYERTAHRDLVPECEVCYARARVPSECVGAPARAEPAPCRDLCAACCRGTMGLGSGAPQQPPRR